MAVSAETIRLYDKCAYDTDFQGVILEAVPGKKEGTAEVVLDRTLFFPEEGGQTPDRGMLAGFPVIDVQISKSRVITHTLDISRAADAAASPPSFSSDAAEEAGRTAAGNAPALPAALRAGQSVRGRVDWDHRYSNMQNHTGEHILSGLLHNLYRYENVGFRLSDNTVTLDTGGHLTPEQVLDLERRANEVVWSDVPVTCAYPPPEKLAQMDYRCKKEIEGDVRIVVIEGVDSCACCAPHVRRTGEIGLIKILSSIHARGGATRITLVCGSRALELMQARQAQAEECSRLMNEPQENIAGGVKRLQEEIAALKEEVRTGEQHLSDLLFAQASAAAPPQEEIGRQDIWLFAPGLSALSQRGLMNRLCDMGWRYAGVFVGDGTGEWKYLIGSRGGDARIPNSTLKEAFGARGGGKPEMVQGTVRAKEREVRSILAAL